jgi:hypothetical protein
MCLIVDNDVAHWVFGAPLSVDAVPIWQWLKKDGKLIFGGKLEAELKENHAIRRLLVQLERAGRAFRPSVTEVNVQQEALQRTGLVRSNDPHVLALAAVTGARTLVTSDRMLMADFRNRRLLSPRGRIYRRALHRKLLVHTPGCQGYREGRR